MTQQFKSALTLFCLFLTFGLTACTTVNESNPARTAMEELLISTAADRAADKLVLALPFGSKVFVDGSNFEGTDSKYALAAIHHSLLAHNLKLMDKRENAQIIVEVRAGALSTQKSQTLVGLNAFDIPVPFASNSVAIPEIALYSKESQTGIAKFAATAYDPKDGSLVAYTRPEFGFSHNEKQTILLFISWKSNDVMPDKNGDVPKAFNE